MKRLILSRAIRTWVEFNR